jgi:hypothetical protein
MFIVFKTKRTIVVLKNRKATEEGKKHMAQVIQTL